MSSFLRRTLAALVLASSPILATIPASAQDPGDPPTDVARIAAISGSVSSHQPGSQNWEGAQQNYPLAPGSGVWTEPRSHAAVDVAGARIHLDASSQLEVTAINPGQVQLAVPQGAAVVRVYPGVSGVEFQVNTPHGDVTINQPGAYEIVAGDDQHPSSVSVIEGEAQLVGQTANLALQAGQRGSIDPNNQAGVDAAQPDDFVRMVQQAEQPYQQQVAQTARYVSPQQTGYQDLARYGQWDQAPQYGAVWYPQAVPANWAPYRYGHWAYVQPWGWTWVDDAAWGFTPFHYGRWVRIGHRWAWVPGERVVRPVYAPALVSFFDLGGVGINVSLGWVPLAPQEVYVPPYRHSPRYVRAVNITNVRNETTIINVVNQKTVVNVNNYRNYRGATSAPRDVMERGRAVGPAWSRNGQPDFDQQWKQAKPEREVAFQPQGDGEGKPGNGPKFAPRAEQNWKNPEKPATQPNLVKASEPQPLPQAAPKSAKKWSQTGQPKSNAAPAPKPVAPQDASAQSKWSKPKAAQPAAITPAASKPVQPAKPLQEQATKKTEWKKQQPNIQYQPARDNRPAGNQPWQQPGENGNQHSDKAQKAKPAPASQPQQQPQQQKKQGQNCGQPQAGACH